MPASELLRLPESVEYKWWETPRQLVRRPFDAQSCPMCRGLFECFESLELLALAFRLALRARFVTREGLTPEERFDDGSFAEGLLASRCVLVSCSFRGSS